MAGMTTGETTDEVRLTSHRCPLCKRSIFKRREVETTAGIKQLYECTWCMTVWDAGQLVFEQPVRVALGYLIEALHKEYGWFNEEELCNTADRMHRFYEEWRRNDEFKFTMFSCAGVDELVLLKDIDFYSLCAHHMLPFYGKVHIAYLPDPRGGICGVSKLARTALKMASKPQTQEAMTDEIADFVEKKTGARFVMVIVEAAHLCMLMRGVKQSSSKMVTSAVRHRTTDEGQELVDWKSLKEEVMRLVK